MLAVPLTSALPCCPIQPWQELGEKPLQSPLWWHPGLSISAAHQGCVGTWSQCPQCPCCVQTPALLSSWLCAWGVEGCPHGSWGGHLVEKKVRAQMMSWRGENGPTEGVSVSGGCFCLHLPLVRMCLCLVYFWQVAVVIPAHIKMERDRS